MVRCSSIRYDLWVRRLSRAPGLTPYAMAMPDEMNPNPEQPAAETQPEMPVVAGEVPGEGDDGGRPYAAARKRRGDTSALRRLKAIFFDIDDTLYSTTEFAEMARRNAIENMIGAGLQMHKDDAYRELTEVIQEFTSNHPAHFDKFLSRIPKHYYENTNPAILVAAGIVGYHDTKHRYLAAYEDVIDVLKRLHAHTDLMLGIITAGLEIKQAEKVWRLGIYPYIDPRAIFISDQIGISKPNPKLYQRACREMDIRAPQAMYVGDNWPHDVDPPNEIGMITVLSRRGGRHINARGTTQPDYEIHNFWDLLEILASDFGIDANRPVPRVKGGVQDELGLPDLSPSISPASQSEPT